MEQQYLNTTAHNYTNTLHFCYNFQYTTKTHMNFMNNTHTHTHTKQRKLVYSKQSIKNTKKHSCKHVWMNTLNNTLHVYYLFIQFHAHHVLKQHNYTKHKTPVCGFQKPLKDNTIYMIIWLFTNNKQTCTYSI